MKVTTQSSDKQIIISKLIALGLAPLPVAPFQATPIGKKTKKPIFTGKNPSYLTSGVIGAVIVTHSAYQAALPTEKELKAWFADSRTGIGCLGSHRYRWLDLDSKHFANQGDCDLALLAICPHALDGWLEQTQSGGYRLLVDCGNQGVDFTNFALTEGGDHVGELLGAGRFAVLAPTIGVSGNYTNINYGDPIPLDELAIFTTSVSQAIVEIKPSLPIAPLQGTIELFSCVTPATQSILTGNAESADKSADLTKVAKELYGWTNWLNANSINFNGSADTLINDCGEALRIDSDRIERIKKTIDALSCLPACVIKGGDESAQKKIKKLSIPLSQSEVTVASSSKKYHVQFVHLCDRHVQRILMGESETVTMALVLKVYRELKGWENAISKFAPDTVATVSIDKIIDWLCEQNHFDASLVKAEIAKVNRKSDLSPLSFSLATIKEWRCKFLEVGTADEIKNFDKEQRDSLKGRVKRILITNLKFNVQINEWFEYVDGVFVIKSKDAIHGVIRHHFKLLAVADWHLNAPAIKEQTVKEFLEEMKSGCQIALMDDPSLTNGLINLQDAVYNRYTSELLPHSQEYGFTVQLPYKWSDASTASAAPIVRWLWESLDGQIDQVFFALCFFNAIVCRRSDIQVLLQIIGKAGSGKSTFTRLAEALIGGANVQATQMELLDVDKFELSNFIGKPLILINEIDSNYKGDGSILKGLTGGDRMLNRIKHHQSRGKDFVYYGKVLITANEEFKPLRVYDDWDRRNRVLRFQKTVEKSKVRDLIENLEDGSIGGDFAPHVPAFLKLVLSISPDLVKQVLVNPETYAPSMSDIRQDSILKESSIAQWLEECVILNPEAITYIGVAKKIQRTTTHDGVSISQTVFEHNQDKFHPHYAQYCTDRGMSFTGQQRFSPDILRICNGTLKLDFVKRLNRDSIGTAIAGLELRTKFHDDIPTPIKNQLIGSGQNTDVKHDQTLANADVTDNRGVISQYKNILKEYLYDLDICNSSNTNDDHPINNSKTLLDNNLNICIGIDPTAENIGKVSVSSALKQGDVVVVDIADIEAAKYVAQQCKVALWFSEYTVERLATIHGAEMAYISNGKPVEMPICIEYLRKVGSKSV